MSAAERLPAHNVFAALRRYGKLHGLNCRNNVIYREMCMSALQLPYANAGSAIQQHESELERRAAQLKASSRLQMSLEVGFEMPHRHKLTHAIEDIAASGKCSAALVQHMSKTAAAANCARHKPWLTLKAHPKCNNSSIPQQPGNCNTNYANDPVPHGCSPDSTLVGPDDNPRIGISLDELIPDTPRLQMHEPDVDIEDCTRELQSKLNSVEVALMYAQRLNKDLRAVLEKERLKHLDAVQSSLVLRTQMEEVEIKFNVLQQQLAEHKRCVSAPSCDQLSAVATACQYKQEYFHIARHGCEHMALETFELIWDSIIKGQLADMVHTHAQNIDMQNMLQVFLTSVTMSDTELEQHADLLPDAAVKRMWHACLCEEEHDEVMVHGCRYLHQVKIIQRWMRIKSVHSFLIEIGL
eukprot:gnl/MRDRNA2_/MRDRNA2_83746_c0_seq1.p1 gnl/MRDRNA2_/MRDRNA2_83746_c0~~gnl/MRDRNA2_/MRDRNA2_83746_c0_seq1.p1  ORF type:complete len:411 (+),score=86.70 gnl/MRDRNA2_/MRDRNA2_83746_c0_seq1:130-1362(+)